MRTRKGHKVYPLTVAQKFHLYYLPFCPTAAVLNIGTSLTIEVELDWELLAKSINKAYERSEGMRIRFAKDKEGTYYQYVEDPEEKEIEFVDFSGKTLEEAQAVMQQWTTVPFKMEDSPMTKVVMIKMPDGFNGIYFLGHHMVVDAQSLICFATPNTKAFLIPRIWLLILNSFKKIWPMRREARHKNVTSNTSRKKSKKENLSTAVSMEETSWKPPGLCSRIRSCAPRSTRLMTQNLHWTSSIWRPSQPSV